MAHRRRLLGGIASGHIEGGAWGWVTAACSLAAQWGRCVRPSIGDRPQQFLPVHSLCIPVMTSCIRDQYGPQQVEIQAERRPRIGP
jgi:hypothetical protein